MSTTGVDPTNEAQVKSWDGAEGGYWAAHHEQFDSVLGYYQPTFETACGVGTDDCVLDIGCGTGSTTRAAARAARQGTAVGVDLSSRMLEVASVIAAQGGLANVRFERADAQVHPFPTAVFDVAISRTGAMFFGDPEQARPVLHERPLRGPPPARSTSSCWDCWDGCSRSGPLRTDPEPAKRSGTPWPRMPGQGGAVRLRHLAGHRSPQMRRVHMPSSARQPAPVRADCLTPNADTD